MEKMAFRSLLLYLVILFSRPQEIFLYLVKFRVLLCVSILSVLLFIMAGYMNRIFKRDDSDKVITWLYLLTLWIIITLPFSRWLGGSIHTFYSQYLSGFFLFLLLVNIVDSWDRLKQVINVLLIAFSVNLVWAGYQKMFSLVDVSNDYGRLGGTGVTFSSSNLLAFLIMLFLPLCVYQMLIEKKFIKKLLLICFVLIAVYDFVGTTSRSGFIGLIVMLAILIYDLLKLKKGSVAILVVFAICMGSFFVNESFKERMTTIFHKSSEYNDTSYSASSQAAVGSSKARNALVDIGVEIIKTYPLFGVGMGSFKIGNRDITGEGSVQVSHVTYIDYAAELGLPGLMLYLLMIYSAITGINKSIKNSKRYSDNSKISEIYYMFLALRCSVIVYMFTSTFISIGYECYIYLLLGLIVAAKNIFKKELLIFKLENDKVIASERHVVQSDNYL